MDIISSDKKFFSVTYLSPKLWTDNPNLMFFLSLQAAHSRIQDNYTFKRFIVWDKDYIKMDCAKFFILTNILFNVSVVLIKKETAIEILSNPKYESLIDKNDFSKKMCDFYLCDGKRGKYGDVSNQYFQPHDLKVMTPESIKQFKELIQDFITQGTEISATIKDKNQLLIDMEQAMGQFEEIKSNYQNGG